MNLPIPYLSVVVTARNDDHGGNLLGRMQAFVNHWIGQAQRHQLTCELIIVEWNPTEGRPSLRDALRWPRNTGPCHVRIVEVPAEVHACYSHSQALPLYQMIAKNAGVRRARGEFILVTNIDILFSTELVQHLAQRKLQPGRMYRIDRYDVMSDVPIDGTVDEQLAYCQNHLLRINCKEGTFRLTPEGEWSFELEDIASAETGIVLGSGWFAVERDTRVFRCVDNDAEVIVQPHSEQPPPLLFDLEPAFGTGRGPFVLQVFTDNGNEPASTKVRGRTEVQVLLPPGKVERRLRFHVVGGGIPSPIDPRMVNFRVFQCGWKTSLAGQSPVANAENMTRLRSRRASLPSRARNLFVALRELLLLIARSGPALRINFPVNTRLRSFARYLVKNADPAEPPPAPENSQTDFPVFLHTNGCGDFTLMAREHWFDLRGYPEWDMFSMNLDSVLCYSAHHGGAEEEILPDPMRIYHIEHATGSGWTPEGQGQLRARIAAKGIPALDHRELAAWASQMRRLHTPMIFNRENWGLVDVELTESEVPAATTAR